MKTYLGDGCYATLEGSTIVLTAEDGIRVTDQVYLEPEVYRALVMFRDEAFGDATAQRQSAAKGEP